MIPLLGLALFAISFGVAAGLLPWIRRRAVTAGAVDRPDGGRKDHAEAVAYGGGVAVLAAIAVPVGLGILVALIGGDASWVPEAIRIHSPGIRQQAPQVAAILGGAAVMMVMGWIDDRRRLPAVPRLIVEILAALALALSGVRVTAFLPEPWMHVAATVVFVVFATNATNFIDNMNGQLTGVAAIQTAGFLAIAASSGQLFVAASLICLLGGLLAFLPWNFPRARIFLGDAGSLPIGFLLSALTITCRFQDGGITARPFVVPILLLFVPLVDGCVVVVSRLRRGVHPFTAGHDHLAHRIAARGRTRTSAVVVLWGFSAAAAALALLVSRPAPLVTLVCVAPVAVVLSAVARRPP